MVAVASQAGPVSPRAGPMKGLAWVLTRVHKSCLLEVWSSGRSIVLGIYPISKKGFQTLPDDPGTGTDHTFYPFIATWVSQTGPMTSKSQARIF